MSLFNSPQNSKYLFLDMNSYFASCEQESHPEYRGKPVAVTPVNTGSGCIVSASYEAKSFGVKTGMFVGDAKKLCPGIIIRESDTHLYLDYHKKWVQVLNKISPFISVKSVDEAALMLSPSERNSEHAYSTAIKIKNAIESRVGKFIRSSIGIGPNVFLAKQGSDYQKPDGLFEIKIENIREYFTKIKLTDIKGINFRMEKRLINMGFKKPVDLFDATPEKLKSHMGIMGEYWYFKLHGFDFKDRELPLPKSIGHSHVLPPKYRSWKCAMAVCQKLAEKAGHRLRSYGLQAEGIYLGIRYLSHGGWHKGFKIQPFSDNITLANLLMNLWKLVPKDDNLPIRVGMVLFNLSKPHYKQARLFNSYEKRDNLSFAVDFINDKYGAFTIKSASILLVENSAPERIAFGRPNV